ncbi:hypothetical protein PUMCH_002834 [Australozyma saopauloensis]|uniref:UDP-N-acetylglucosamine transferase subunit ALG14 n=1 Tax=Australozyma saopauloensis TaxID=291208 RepID=A0AAX4HAD7_9ASCO|nr:hypothetical protein PUMCH_002834 [[Candida] saopauloensis]
MSMDNKLMATTLMLCIPCILIIIRLLCVLPSVKASANSKQTKHNILRNDKCQPTRIMALLGSGGHTGEMVRLLSDMELEKYQLTWLVSEGDSTSLLKARGVEESKTLSKAEFIVLARARKVGEPLVLSLFSTLRSLYSTATKLYKTALPDILLINGPGTCVPVAYFLFFLRFVGLGHTRIVYIESMARVNGLSLSGKLVLPICDRFVVQWRPLAVKYHRAEYYGLLI